ncbi:MAG: hypothetical protein A3A33_05110 [Candidatus Yanofskybacteria bacterium RIFCSPLOWO2_01_FULL_49_25]|uniref:Enolase n=1 Tax=Candidatus Yanofskybacteria bacterium RIFCSPLOWO2_01_FULL_49_25 TaxID=1802701 RepID=A0A1F8GVA3_9BACT|nr:MAG: hypothetical protein A3A33_05110 [Candidatus Yanofskybacteria bacterium RIFCSPLOWO2_01_FULL_49_25]
MTNITGVEAVEIKDSRGLPTLRATVHAGDVAGVFDVPSGASTGSHEALELRDGGEEQNGKGIRKALEAVNGEIAKTLIGMDVSEQKKIDDAMCALDGTSQKSRLGGNAIIGVSIATAKAAAASNDAPFYKYLRSLRTIEPTHRVPFLFMNVLNGGKHAKNGPAFQEYHIIPQTDDVEVSKKIGESFMDSLDIYAKNRFGENYGVGDEGGLVFPITDVTESLAIMRSIADEANFAVPVRFGLDVAASSFYDEKARVYHCGDRDRTPAGMLELYQSLVKEYNLYSIEDPFQEEAFEDFAKLQSEIDPVLLVGDDLTVTNVARLKTAIDARAIKAMIIKPNQIGTLTETLDTMELARKNGIHCIVSHRSGDTMDDAIADIAYAFGTLGLKCGVPRQKERIIKINRLIHISHEA